MMKLNELLATWPIAATFHSNGTVSIPDAIIGQGRFQFWRLSDYRVSSVIGGAIWLTPKN